ncbi:MAG: GNAT family N-acetyltransferase [Gammaproteobacteria bacterium]|nr:GNAT family N-acetyltransferase [Gammaproteobacteria bacterium]
MTEFHLRRAGPDELAALLPLFQAYRDFYRCPADAAGCANYLAQRLAEPATGIALATIAGAARGFVQLFPQPSSLSLGTSYYLSDLYVAPEARRLGLAAALLDWARHFAHAQGARGLSLETARDNHAAQALYRRLGWRLDEHFLTFRHED